jgi:hypothetical protein
MAGGGQVRPMGGAMQSALNSGQGIGNFVNSALGANPNPAPMRGNPAPAPMNIMSGNNPAPSVSPPSVAPQGNFNVNQAAAGGLQQAMQGTQGAYNYQPAQIQATGYNPAMQSSVGSQQGFGYNAGQIAGSDLSAYQNPYESQVVQNTLSDIGKAQEMSLNQMGAQATQANAFGGSRHGIAEAETRKNFANQALNQVAGLRQQGFNQALQNRQFDIGQQTAASQFGATSAQAAQAANIARLQNIQAQNAAARTGANQYLSNNLMAAQQQNVSNQMANRNAQLSAANQMGQLGQQAFNTGQTIQQQQAQQGILQQGMQQALIDAAKAQYAGYTGSPTAALSAPLAALGATPNQSTTTNSMQPGLFNYLQLGASMFPGGRK